MEQLERLQTVEGGPLPPRLKVEVLREPQRLELAIGMIRDVETERDGLAKGAAMRLNADKVQALAKLRAIGPEFAVRRVGEVFCRSFDNRRQLGSFAGLTPSPGSAARQTAIGHQQSQQSPAWFVRE